MLVKDTPVKDMPVKGDLVPSKKVLTPDQTVEPPVKKQHTGSPSSKQESETDHGKGGKNKQKKKKKARSNPIMVSDSEMEETKEQKEKCQWAKKWAQEMEQLWLYRESRNIFFQDLLARNGHSHVGYLEGHIQDTSEGHSFIRSFSDWRNELQKQSQGLGLRPPLHVGDYRCSSVWIRWSCQTSMASTPSTWWKCLNIPVQGTIFCWTPMICMGWPRWLACMALLNHTPLQG